MRLHLKLLSGFSAEPIKLALFKEYLSMTDSYSCFSAYHVALEAVYPTDNYSCTFNGTPN